MIPIYGLAIVILLLGLVLLSGKAGRIRRALTLKQWVVGGGSVVGLSALLLTSPRLALLMLAGLVGASVLPALVRYLGRGTGSNAHPQSGAPGGSSSVNTDWLSATLDHESGAMDASILCGAYTGRRLRELSVQQLVLLLEEMAQANAQESSQIVEAFLEQNHPDWQEQASNGASESGQHDQPLTRERALEILGLASDADDQAIVAAHRRLIRLMHPDRGGSSYLAAQLNSARDFLLERSNARR